MFYTDITFYISKGNGHNIHFTYSKWTGSIKIFVDESLVEQSRIVFGSMEKDFKISLDNTNLKNIVIKVFPGKAFWVEPLIQIVVNNKLFKSFQGNRELNLDSVGNTVSKYQLPPLFADATKYLKVLVVIVGGLFALSGVAIVPVTAWLHPEELHTNVLGMGIGITVSFTIAVSCFIMGKFLNKAQTSKINP